MTASRSEDDAVVQLRGELDLANSRDVRDILVDLLGSGLERVTIDLAEVSFIDSTGLGALIRAAEAAQHSGVLFTGVNPTLAVRRVMEMSGVDTLLLNGSHRRPERESAGGGGCSMTVDHRAAPGPFPPSADRTIRRE